ncbi:MAG: geranylgeranylglycerol-phosphate geranylgeranyltransferase [Ignavibacteria bacterium]|jgi:geranylgeranylglycerol-phosphate geranylgeranyltransferase
MTANKIKSIIEISRPVNFFITFIAVVFSGLIVSNNIEPDLIYSAFSLAFACAAGNIINDTFDLEIDKINKPARVLPGKRLSVGQAYLIYFILVSISMLLSFQNGIYSIAFLFAVNLILFLYSKYLKKIILVGNITVALLTSSALLYGALVYGNITKGLIPAFFAFLINLVREIIKDIEDISGDKKLNVVTFPQKYGINTSLKLSILLIISLGILSTLPYVLEIYKIEYFVIIMLTVNVIFAYIIKLLTNDHAVRSLVKTNKLIKLNMVLGLIAIYAGS